MTPEQQQQNEHFDDTVSEIRQFSKTWTDYCNETVENLLDMEVELVRLENKLLFCYDSEIDKKLEEFNKTLSIQSVVSSLSQSTSIETTVAPSN